MIYIDTILLVVFLAIMGACIYKVINTKYTWESFDPYESCRDAITIGWLGWLVWTFGMDVVKLWEQ